MKPQTSSPISNVKPIKRNSPGVKKIWTIDHACGHSAERDLSNRAADRRAGVRLVAGQGGPCGCGEGGLARRRSHRHRTDAGRTRCRTEGRRRYRAPCALIPERAAFARCHAF
ncbi:hypothetical protein GXW83_28275 [Streptacidiphilus sp. PB12-B1b]|uniref:hypothetical protein n=1 Tax=Streptacidiphilus sp. PB12-B1b TaxID=2705012 RepID=UPI0015FB3D0B|nr:hypothetical protein [Streptacidiphilus sp. PB12-B1b]QMU74414.1 hypothetical protein GXW83_28275 [Streptacidiphilus sp. PB12-B1b]